MPIIKNQKIISIVTLFVISVSFVLLCSTTTSPLYLSNPCWNYGDSGIFQEMGLVIVNGGTPYVDVFDHKGPVLFFIQALGLWINEYWGIFCLQCLSLFVTAFIWYKTILLFKKSELLAIICIVISLVFLFGYYQRGNLCEEWSLPFISLSIFLLVKNLRASLPTSNKEWLIIGLCTCTVLFIRANNIAPILGFAIYALFNDIASKSHVILLHILFGLLGCIIVVVFWILIFYYCYGKETLSWMIYGTFLHNYGYIQKGKSIGTLQTLLYYVSIVCFVIVTIVAIMHNRKAIAIPLLVSYLISIFAIGTNKFDHYLIIFIPLFVISMALLQSVRWYHWVFMTLTTIQIAVFSKTAIDILVVRIFRELPDRPSSDDFHRWITSLPEKEKNGIYNYSSIPTYYFAEEKMVHENRCVLQSHFDDSQRIRDIERVDGILQKEPIWVLGPELSQLNSSEQVFLKDNYSVQDSILNCEESRYVYCYRRNEQ